MILINASEAGSASAHELRLMENGSFMYRTVGIYADWEDESIVQIGPISTAIPHSSAVSVFNAFFGWTNDGTFLER